MKVRITDLPSKQSITLGPDFVRGAIGGLAMRKALGRPEDDEKVGNAQAELELQLLTDNVFARGWLRGWLEVACGRCVGPARIEFSENLMVSYLPRARVPEDSSSSEEVEVTEDDLDVYPYDEDEINLEPLLREQLILAVPYTPLCKDDCKGLCTVCGTDLNAGECACDRDVIDPRLVALKDIKL